LSEHLTETPWDAKVFGIPTFEIRTFSAEVLDAIKDIKGHFTVKVDPVASKKILHDYDFYYCDTLIEPYCSPERLISFEDEAVDISSSTDIGDLIDLSHGVFVHGRFQRDFNIGRDLADLRYDNWLKDLHAAGNVLGLMYQSELAGFFGLAGNRIVLHAVSERYRNKGLAKYLWSAGCREMISRGHSEISSSISASNMPALNLYASLGFRFRNPLDVYHHVKR
jgi:ribosomal protein S18 acetylase RimI-like enzyme